MAIKNGIYRFALIFLGGIVLGLIVYVKSKSVRDISLFLLIYTIFITTFELSRLISAIFYHRSLRAIRKANEGAAPYEPTVSFVIPCKNEEATIHKTIIKCFEAEYPKEKLEVIVINDGSTDRTGEVLYRMQERYPELKIIDWKVNQGKRHGMTAGFNEAKGEIVVQLDSDSYIVPETFRKLIEPFRNPEIGAVCAHADPENADENLITRMQAGYYFMSFRILKAAESSFMTVFCCSGCSSAYRKSVVLPIMNTWLHEKFLGLPVTWGDDRALTNWVLKLGYRTIYTDDAKAYTICPNSLRVFLKQQVRWKKGWFVNSLFASKFVYRKYPFVGFTYFLPLIIVTLLTPFMAAKAFVYGPLVLGHSPIYYLLGVFLVAVLITIFYRYVAPQNKYWKYVFLWSAINTFLLSFILFYALARLKDRRWGTR
ncbi:MAG TPA: glycosyltransferase [Candidatus Paceibacterota bacterium]|nr:glycosyltransferase [Candidatus Paceibacterota bacterium]